MATLQDPMGSSEDLANTATDAVPADDQSIATQGADGGDAPPPIKVCIEITPDGQISVYDEGGEVQPKPAENLQDALKSAGELCQELSKRMAVSAIKARQEQRPGNAQAQSIWDELAANRPARGNT